MAAHVALLMTINTWMEADNIETGLDSVVLDTERERRTAQLTLLALALMPAAAATGAIASWLRRYITMRTALPKFKCGN